MFYGRVWEKDHIQNIILLVWITVELSHAGEFGDFFLISTCWMRPV